MGNNRCKLSRQRDQKGLFALVEFAPLPLLHHQNTENLALVDDRHSEKSVERFLTDLRNQVEPRMHGGVVQIDGLGALCHQPNEPLLDREADLTY